MVVIFVCSIGGIQPAVQTKAATEMDLEAVVQSKTSVKLKWKKKKVTSYVIYRRISRGKFKKIATVSAKKTSYVDKKVKGKKSYDYKIYGYQKKKKAYFGETDVYTGVPETDWVECQELEAENTPKSLTLRWDVQNGLATGYEIYRAENFGDFKKLKTLPSRQLQESDYREYSYIDKTVKAKHIYSYKIRAYYVKAGNKEYGTFSRIVQHRAINYHGKYEVKPVKEQAVSSSAITSPSAVTVAITSAEYNGDLVMSYSDDDYSVKYVYEDKEKEKEEAPNFFVNAYIYAYSNDGKHWKKPASEDVRIKEGETVYICFGFKDGKGNPVDITSMTSVKIHTEDQSETVSYDGSYSRIEFDVKKDTSFETEILGFCFEYD